MTLNDYQLAAARTAVYSNNVNTEAGRINYTLVALGGEVGEALNKWKKRLRGDRGPMTFVDEDLRALNKEMALELGDVLWYLSEAARNLGFTLEQVAQWNLEKLKKRAEKDLICGDGDNREV